jgi:hypothetical protein
VGSTDPAWPRRLLGCHRCEEASSSGFVCPARDIGSDRDRYVGKLTYVRSRRPQKDLHWIAGLGGYGILSRGINVDESEGREAALEPQMEGK